MYTGTTEEAAKLSAQGVVQDLGYVATFPLLLNIAGEPTYFIPLKDATNLVKTYAMVNVLAMTQNTTYKNVHCHVKRSATSHNFHKSPNHLKRIPIFLNHLWNFQIILRITDNHSRDSLLNRLLGA